MTAPPFLGQLRQALAGQDRRSYCDILVAGIQDAISDKTLKPGDVLPSERDLTAVLDVSRNVIRRAIATLEADGILSTRHGHGTFVPKDLRKSTNSILGFSEEMTRRGLTVSNRIIKNVVRQPTGPEAIDLGIAPQGELREVVRLRLADGVPIAHEVALVPAWAVPDGFDGDRSLYAAMEAEGTRPVRVLQEIGAAAADGAVAEGLDIEPGSPVLRITRKGLDAGNAVVEFTVSSFRSDRYTWITELRR